MTVILTLILALVIWLSLYFFEATLFYGNAFYTTTDNLYSINPFVDTVSFQIAESWYRKANLMWEEVQKFWSRKAHQFFFVCFFAVAVLFCQRTVKISWKVKIKQVKLLKFVQVDIRMGSSIFTKLKMARMVKNRQKQLIFILIPKISGKKKSNPVELANY